MATKSFIKTIGSKGLLADYNTEGKKLQTELTAGDNITIDGNTISSDQVFVATFGKTKYAEIKAAYNAGKICTVHKGNLYYYIVYVGEDNIRLVAPNTDPKISSVSVHSSDDHWSSYDRVLQSKLAFDTEPTAGSKNPVTSNGIRTMQPFLHRFDDETSSRLIIWGKANSAGYIVDMIRKFGLQYGSMTDFLFANSVHKDNTTSVNINILNASSRPTTSTKRLKASIFKDSSENSYFALWLDGSISQPQATYYADYYPDVSEKDSIVRHFTVFNPSEYTHVRDLTIKYIPFAVPNPSVGVLTSNGSSNSWLTPPASGTAILKSVNGVIQWVTE